MFLSSRAAVASRVSCQPDNNANYTTQGFTLSPVRRLSVSVTQLGQKPVVLKQLQVWNSEVVYMVLHNDNDGHSVQFSPSVSVEALDPRHHWPPGSYTG